MNKNSMLLLKMHGSLNWRIQKCHKNPYIMNSILHHEKWIKYNYILGDTVDIKAIDIHMEPDPFIVPPLLTKELFKRQPILRSVWLLAYEKLKRAKNIIFIGYSFPKTDIISEFLFNEEY